MRIITSAVAVALLLSTSCEGASSDAETGSSTAAASVVWRNAAGVRVRGNDLVKTSPLATWRAGAASTAELDGDGYVELTTGENDTAKLAGLSHRDGSQTYADIDPPGLSAWGVLGIAFDAADPIVIDGTGRTMWRIDAETAGVLDTFPMQAAALFTQGLAFDSQHLFTVRDNRLATVDPGSGEVVLAPRAMPRFNFLALAVEPSTGDLWMVNDCWDARCTAIGGTQLWRVDKETGRATRERNFSPLGLGQAMSLAISADGDFHAGIRDGHGVTRIWRLDPVTGAARLETRTGLSGLLIGLAVDPTVRRLVGIEERGQRYYLVAF